ncbi:hypothetical protein Tco_1101584 [Tanacetum coccineum]
MGDANPIRTLGDYSKPSHKGYRNTIELPIANNVINFLLKGSRPTPGPSSTHVPQAYAEAVYSNPRSRNQNKPPKQSPFTFRERTGPFPQPQELGTTFKARVWDYMAAHTKRMERFENAIFKQREEISDKMAEMFGLLKELTTSRGEEERNNDNDVATCDDIEKPTRTETGMPVNEAENWIKNEPIRKAKKEETTKAPNSKPVEYYLKHMINEKLIEGLVDNHRGAVYEAILSKKITRKEDIGGNFKIPCNIGGLIHMNALVDQGSDVNIMPLSTYMKLTDERHFDKCTKTLRSEKSKISFNRILGSLYKDEKGIKNDIEPISPTMTLNMIVFKWEEKIKLHQEKEMKFDRWRNKNFKNERTALVKIEYEVDDKREVTLYLTRRSLEVLGKFNWTIIGGRFNQLTHVSSPLLSKPGEY